MGSRWGDRHDGCVPRMVVLVFKWLVVAHAQMTFVANKAIIALNARCHGKVVWARMRSS